MTQSSTTITSLPVAAWKNGDFNAVLSLDLYDPASGNPDGTGRQPFASNVIPISRPAQASSGLLPLIPEPNLSGFINNLNVSVTGPIYRQFVRRRIDHNFSAATKFFAKFNTALYDVEQRSALGDVVDGGATGDEPLGRRVPLNAGPSVGRIEYNRVALPVLLCTR
jgi:hypothetical protein